MPTTIQSEAFGLCALMMLSIGAPYKENMAGPITEPRGTPPSSCTE